MARLGTGVMDITCKQLLHLSSKPKAFENMICLIHNIKAWLHICLKNTCGIFENSTIKESPKYIQNYSRHVFRKH